MNDPAHEEEFFRALATASGELRQAFAAQIGMSPQRLHLLMRLLWRGESTHSDLRQTLGIDAATVTRMVKEFEAEGLLTRRVDPANNRYTLTTLTPTGKRLARRLERDHHAYQHRLLDGITAEQTRTVLDVLGHIRANITTAKARP
ncbi:MarR family winged helix-turn-helix transcriptional regulator [Nocardia sp. NPDC051990]|uniref:MarR family winged helix-turn-helix transcriptional regulator n=1 Tax=Nocardia sp. NPDC051990 TaxID=3155285 RepID=UPI00343FA86E